MILHPFSFEPACFWWSSVESRLLILWQRKANRIHSKEKLKFQRDSFRIKQKVLEKSNDDLGLELPKGSKEGIGSGSESNLQKNAGENN